jgi:cyclophilin family peptidyl-prolyl cis-trans isomerase
MIRSRRHVLFGLALAVAAVACSTGGAPRPSPTSSPSSSPLSSQSPVASEPSTGGGCPTTPPPALAAGTTRTVTIETTPGTITIAVEADLGPLAAGNFVALAECGFYDGVVFHRLVPGFVIQGGDPTGNGSGGPGYEFANDPVTVPYDRGIVAMANAGRDTNGSQFFIVLQDNDTLPPDYSVFGRVTAGMEVVDAIAAMPNAGELQGNAAIDPVAMDSVTVSTP